jgi:tetratricopeptide (TPR) repeat protein
VRPGDPTARFNLADGLYKNGRFDEAAQLYRELGRDPASPLAGPARFNLGNALFEKKDYPGAVQAYRDALRALPRDEDTRRNLELALRALKEQQQKQQQQSQKPGPEEKKPEPSQGGQKPGERPPSPEERERERFEREAGMPKERALQLLEALQRNEKAEQRKALLAKRRERKGKDW